MAALEVIITLVPISSPSDLVRRFKLSSTESSIYIGRASKNEAKGLLANVDNAWFDSPIMSRQHALLSMSSLPKRVTIQDCGSTHGTFISGQRLEAEKTQPLNEHDIVTFGTKVTSGTEIYPAKEFSVSYEWKTAAPSNYHTMMKPIPHNSSFQVPDADSDDSSQVSLDDSVEILESHPRTYSIPSDDEYSTDEEDDIPTADKSKNSLGLTKGVSETVKVNTQATNNNGPVIKGQIMQDSTAKSPEVPSSSRGSQANPIILESMARKESIDIDSDGDDGGPDVLPFVPASTWNKPLTPEQAFNSEPQNQSNGWSGDFSFSAPHFVETVGVDGWRSEDEDDVDRGFSTTAEVGDAINDQDQPSKNHMNVSRHHESLRTDQPLTGQSYANVIGGDNNIVQGQAGGTVVRSASLERAPSPSDAALVKKASLIDANDENQYHPSATSNHLTHSYYLSTEDARESAISRQSDVVKALQDGHANEAHHVEIGPRRDVESHDKHAAIDVQTQKSDTEQGNNHVRYPERPHLRAPKTVRVGHWDETFPDLYGQSHGGSNEAKPYGNGPFSIRPTCHSYDTDWKTPGPQQSSPNAVAFPSPYLGKSFGHDYRYSYPSAHHMNGVDPWADYSVGGQSGMQLRPHLRSSSPTNALGNNTFSKPLWAQKHVSHTAEQVQQSRLPIADLLTSPFGPKVLTNKVGEPELLSPPMSPPSPSSESKGTKRKADELEEDDVDVVPDSFGKDSLIDVESQQSALPDAQPREQVALPETTISQTSKDCFVLQGKSPLQSQLGALAVRETAPARKKVRTAPSTSGGIAKFVSGIAVGVVGALAAFIATVPNDLANEAWREVNKG